MHNMCHARGACCIYSIASDIALNALVMLFTLLYSFKCYSKDSDNYFTHISPGLLNWHNMHNPCHAHQLLQQNVLKQVISVWHLGVCLSNAAWQIPVEPNTSLCLDGSQSWEIRPNPTASNVCCIKNTCTWFTRALQSENIYLFTLQKCCRKIRNFAGPWWRHQMETYSALLAIRAGNSPVTGKFPAQRPVTRSFDVFFDLRLNERLSKQSWCWLFETPLCPLWRHSNVEQNVKFILESPP